MSAPIVVIGKSGQLAYELKQLASEGEIVCLGRDDIDVTQFESLKNTLMGYRPKKIINAAAYTAVDNAENDKEKAFLLNATLAENLAIYCKNTQCHLVHVSTDYVFSGDKGSPYEVDEPHNPMGVYGESKAAGERAINEICADQSCIIRTAWVYSCHGTNFVKTMLRLMNEKPELSVIDDQIGSPTWAKGLAQACLYAAKEKVTGMHHWTDAGVASWYDFAVAIQRIALEKGLLKTFIPIKPIPTRAYPTLAKRPSYSVLDKSTLATSFTGLELKHWQVQLDMMLDELVV